MRNIAALNCQLFKVKFMAIKTDHGEMSHNKLRKFWLYGTTLPFTADALRLKVDTDFLKLDLPKEGYVDIK